MGEKVKREINQNEKENLNSPEEEKRVYFVIDMKSFFASVECSERGIDPYKSCLVVADPARGTGGICLAVSPKMKSLGVPNRCRLYEIPKEIDYIIAKPQMKKYIDYAAEIYGIYLKYIDKKDIHVYSIDECFIDATDYLKLYKLKAKEFAIKLMNEIYSKLQIPSSAGIGSNLYLAKIALDITAKKSPDRIGWLTEAKYKETLWNHTPITDFWQISDGTAKRLSKLGIHNMADLAHADESSIYEAFGINAELLIDHAWGRESCLISDIKSYKQKSKSIGNSQILPCNYDYKSAKLVLSEMIQNGCYELAKYHYVTSAVYITIGYGDRETKSSKGTARLGSTTNLYRLIANSAEDLFERIANKGKMIRRISYEFLNLQNEEKEQYDFFTDLAEIKKEKKLVKSVIDIQKKFGKNAVLKGIDLQKDATQKERNKLIGGHNSGEN